MELLGRRGRQEQRGHKAPSGLQVPQDLREHKDPLELPVRPVHKEWRALQERKGRKVPRGRRDHKVLKALTDKRY